MKPTLVIETYKKSMIKLATDKQAATDALSNANNALSALVKPVNYGHAPIIRKLLNITRAVSLSENEVAALAAIGVQCEGGKLSKTVRENLAIVAKPFLELCNAYEKEAAKIAETIASLKLRLSNIDDDAKRADCDKGKALESFFKTTAIDTAKAFDVEQPCGRYVAELVSFVNSLTATKEDNDKLAEFEGSLIELANCDSSKSPQAAKCYLSGLGLANLSSFIGGLGNVVKAPESVPDVEAGYDDGTPKPPEKPEKRKWVEFAKDYSGELHNRDTITEKSFVRLMALSRRIARHAQKGVLSTIRAAEKSGITSGRLESAVMLSIANMHKILQGGINAGVRLAVETSGKDLSILNRVTQSPLVWGESTGFNLVDFRAYIEDTLPHLEFKSGAWQLRSQRALENRKLGAFGVHIFGQVPARLVCEKPPLFPLLDFVQFRELKKQFAKQAASANKAAKAVYENQWREFEESFPIEQQLESIDSLLSKLDAERQSLVDKAAMLKAAMQ